MINNKGHLVHIDFGFIFDISPANNLRFERANFKLTKEMIKIMGGGGKMNPQKYDNLGCMEKHLLQFGGVSKKPLLQFEGVSKNLFLQFGDV